MDPEFQLYMDRQSVARKLKDFRYSYENMKHNFEEIKKQERFAHDKFWEQFAREMKRNELFLEELEVRWGVLNE